MKSDYKKDPTEYYKHLSLFWTDFISLMANKPVSLTSVGPMRNVTANAKKIATELIDANEEIIEFNKRLTDYYKQLTDTWTVAQKKVNTKISKVPIDVEHLEAYKRVWIDIFESDFSELFDSGKFSENYGKLVSSELELTKRWDNILNVILKSANLPTKNEMDEVYKEIHSLRKKVSKIESELASMKRKK